MGKVLSDRLIVKPQPIEKKTNGIYVHQSAKSKPLTGVVIEVGPLVTGAVPGDIVQFGPNAGSPIPFNGEDHLLLREVEIDYNHS